MSRDALFCKECGDERIRSGGGRKFAKVYCKECGKLLNSGNRSGYCGKHYKREPKPGRDVNKLTKAIAAWQSGEAELVYRDGILTPLNRWKPRDEWKQGGWAPDGTGPGVRW